VLNAGVSCGLLIALLLLIFSAHAAPTNAVVAMSRVRVVRAIVDSPNAR
jgi:hypothetical protein